MPWQSLAIAGIFALTANPVTPLDSAADSVVGYLLGYGPLGIGAVLLARVLYKGTFVRRDTADKAREEAVSLARADLLREVERHVARAEKAEEQRDEAMKFAQVQLVPLLFQFTAATTSLLPILQELVRRHESK